MDNAIARRYTPEEVLTKIDDENNPVKYEMMLKWRKIIAR